MKEIILAAQIAGISATPFISFWQDVDVFSAQVAHELEIQPAESFKERMERIKELGIPLYISGGECDSYLTYPTFEEVDVPEYDIKRSVASNLKVLSNTLDDWVSSFVCLEEDTFEAKKNLHVLSRIIDNLEELAQKLTGDDAPQLFYYSISDEAMDGEAAANYCYEKDMWLADPANNIKKDLILDALDGQEGEFWVYNYYSCGTIDANGAETVKDCSTQLRVICEAGELSETTTTTTTPTTTTTLVPPEDCYAIITMDGQEKYDDAATKCQDIGAAVFYARTVDEYNQFLESGDKRKEWYGIKRTSKYSTTWVNSNGGSEFYTNWNWGEPNNSGYNEGCGEIGITGGLNDIPCDTYRAYSCAKVLPFGESFTNPDDEICQCTGTGLICKPKYTCGVFEKQEEKEYYPDAKANCEAAGGHLAFFKNENEFDLFMDMAKEAEQWIGYERTGPGEKDWITADGSEDFYTNWKNNEPDNEDDNEYCAEIDVDDDGEMSDVPCEYTKDQRGKGEGESKRHYTCRKEVGPGEFFFINIKDDKKGPKGKNKEQICECTENGAECEELSECPQFIRMEGEVTYANASAICAEHNGYVTFFEDEDEFEDFMDEDVKRKEWLGIVRTGYDSDDWEIADGEDDFYTNWNSGEPNNSGGNEWCGEILMMNGGVFNDVPCDAKRAFSCRITKMKRGKC